MAYMGRGGFGGFGNDKRRYYGSGLFRMYTYIPLDNTYVIFQMIVTIIIFITAGITFLSTYKPSIIDPIENTKKILINTYILITLALLVLTILANYFSKDKNALIKRLIVILSLSVITILVFLGIKANMDSTYTKNKFEQIYNQEYSEQNSDSESKIVVSIGEINIKTEKEYYIDECVKAYNIFSIRMYGIIGLNVLLIILLIYQIPKVSRIQEKRDKLSKDDEILFDEEENVKF